VSKEGIVLIGRNEGQRLIRALDAAKAQCEAVVYVDSGSTDNSVAAAQQRGVNVVELDTSVPFTAARARNAGYEELLRLYPDQAFVMFVDGDCELVEGWLTTAIQSLQSNDKLAVVCGRRRERAPEASIFNRLCDMEWDTPIGPSRACGGDAVYRCAAFDAVGRFDPTFICGEEPQLCLRLRQAGWSIERLDAEMTRHDAAMTRWGQWWKRCVRGGWAYAEGADKYGHLPERYKVKEARSNWLWGVVVPALVVAYLLLGALLHPWLLLVAGILLMGYPVLAWRVARYRMACGDTRGNSWLYGVMTVMGKLPYAVGQLRYRRQKRRGGQATLIEYKGAESAAMIDPESEPYSTGAA